VDDHSDFHHQLTLYGSTIPYSRTKSRWKANQSLCNLVMLKRLNKNQSKTN
jgi:hypothetical protein